MPISQWSTTPATNASSATGINWAEGQLPSTVNDSARQLMADVRAWMDDGGWHNWGDTHTYSSGTATLVSGDVTARYHANRSVRAVGSSTGTIYGKIASSSYGAPNTTVNYTWDSGSLVNETLTISLGFSAVTGKPISANGVRGVGTGDLLSTNNLSDVANAATAFGNIKQAATETASGVLEIATAAETTTGTDDVRAITPLKLTTFAPASATLDTANDKVLFTDASDSNKVKQGTLSGSSKIGAVGSASYTTQTTISTGFPNDNTIPQNTEGDEIMTVTITPQNAGSTIVISFYIDAAAAATFVAGAVFQDSTANALFAEVTRANSGLRCQFSVAAGSTSARTYKLRAGDSTGATIHVNKGVSTSAIFGGVTGSYMTVMEFLP